MVREADLPSQIEDFSDSKTETILQKAEKEAIDYGVSLFNLMKRLFLMWIFNKLCFLVLRRSIYGY